MRYLVTPHQEEKYKGFLFVEMGLNWLIFIFADDCLIFCRSILEECNKIQELLTYYEVASGQMINKEETTLFFSKNTDEQS